MAGPRRIPIARAEAGRAGFWTKKHLGQHLLRDPSVAAAVLEALRPAQPDLVLEIGPGLGALTESLLALGPPVLGVELDARACAALRDRFGHEPRFGLVQADVLKADLTGLLAQRGARRACIAANLPYYITTPVLARLLEGQVPFVRLCVLVQREVAERLAAPPGGRQRAALSVMAQYWCQVRILRRVERGAFTPVPKVASALVLFERRLSPPAPVADPALFFRVVRAAFGKRRKTLRTALKMSGLVPAQELEAAFAMAGLDPKRRAETLEIAEWAALSNALTAN